MGGNGNGFYACTSFLHEKLKRAKSHKTCLTGLSYWDPSKRHWSEPSLSFWQTKPYSTDGKPTSSRSRSSVAQGTRRTSSGGRLLVSRPLTAATTVCSSPSTACVAHECAGCAEVGPGLSAVDRPVEHTSHEQMWLCVGSGEFDVPRAAHAAQSPAVC